MIDDSLEYEFEADDFEFKGLTCLSFLCQEFDDSHDADDAVHDLNNKDLLGDRSVYFQILILQKYECNTNLVQKLMVIYFI